MATQLAAPASTTGARGRAAPDDLLLRETRHRSSNDLQLVVSLLSLQSRRAISPETRAALADATARVAVLARARAALNGHAQHDLQTALREVCEGLGSQAEPRGILLSLHCEHTITGLSADAVVTLALVVNELATNAIKHAFTDGRDGTVRVAVHQTAAGDLVVTVEDDGVAMPVSSGVARDGGEHGLGLALARRLIASIDGLLIAPSGPAKRFEIRLPLGR